MQCISQEHISYEYDYDKQGSKEARKRRSKEANKQTNKEEGGNKMDK